MVSPAWPSNTAELSLLSISAPEKPLLKSTKPTASPLFSHKQLMSDDGFAGAIRIKGEKEIYEREGCDEICCMRKLFNVECKAKLAGTAILFLEQLTNSIR